MTLWLVGMMGSGKTSAGRLASVSLGVPFLDTDDEVTSIHGRSVARIWDELGEDVFRESESEVIRRLAGEEAVIATGGGAVLDESNRGRMKSSGRVIWLRCSPEVLAMRVEGSTGRPLLDREEDPKARIGVVLETRSDAYSETADFEIDTTRLSLEQVAQRIEGMWQS